MFFTRFNQQAAPVLMPLISREFFFSSTQVGLYSTFWSVTSSIGSVFLGRLSDIYGVRKILLVSLPLYAVGMFIHGFSSTYTVMLLGASVAGIGYSSVAPCLTKYIRTENSVGNRTKVQAFAMSGLDFGALFGALLLPTVALGFTWRYTFKIIAILPLLAIIFVYLFLRETKLTKETILQNSFWSDIKKLLKLRSFWNIAYFSLLMGGVVGSTLTHFPMFLYEVFSFSPVEAGWGFAFIFVGGTIGRLSAGHISDKYFPYRRHIALGIISGLTGLTCLLISVITLLSYINIPVFLIWLVALLAGMGIFGENPIRFIMAGELLTEANSGMIIGMSLLVARIGFMVVPPLFGYLVDLTNSYAASWIMLAILSIAVAIKASFCSESASSKLVENHI